MYAHNIQTLSPPRRLHLNKDLSLCNIPLKIYTLKITTICSGQWVPSLGCFSVVLNKKKKTATKWKVNRYRRKVLHTSMKWRLRGYSQRPHILNRYLRIKARLWFLFAPIREGFIVLKSAVVCNVYFSPLHSACPFTLQGVAAIKYTVLSLKFTRVRL